MTEGPASNVLLYIVILIYNIQYQYLLYPVQGLHESDINIVVVLTRS